MSMSMSRLIEAAKLQSCRTDVQTNCFNPELRNLQHANMVTWQSKHYLHEEKETKPRWFKEFSHELFDKTF